MERTSSASIGRPRLVRLIRPPQSRQPKTPPVLRLVGAVPRQTAGAPVRVVEPTRAPLKPAGLMERIAAGILTGEHVAWLLACSMDTVRRIPRDRLPAYEGAGRYLLYFLDDVQRYVRSRGRTRANADEILSAVTGQVVGSSSDSGRERSTQGERDD
jgi:hypothetical protein